MLKSISEPNIKIPDHVVVEKIGTGGMSSVYLGKQISLQRKVAIKVLRQPMVDDPTLAERFVDEAKTIALLDHPNIISIYEARKLPSGLSYFTMPYLNHGHFGDIICTNAEHLIDLLCQICDGLACAHEHGVVHRDLKPDNILFDRFGHLKIADFGIALSRNKRRQTKEQQVLGSAHYMSPEQIQSKSVNHLSDIYSLGCIIYEKLTGDNVFNAENDFAILLAHINKPIPELPKSLASWQPILEKCLAKRPQDRYQSALEVKQDLLKIRDQENELNQAKKFSLKLPPWLQTWHAAVAVGLVLLTALFGFLISGSDKQLPSQDAATAVVKQKTTKQPTVTPSKPVTSKVPESSVRDLVASEPTQATAVGEVVADTPEQQEQELDVKLVTVTPLDEDDVPLSASVPIKDDLEEQALESGLAASTEEMEDSQSATDSEQTIEQMQVSTLLHQGQQLLKKYRLTKPKEENALAKFKQVLDLEPENLEAKQGITKIAGSYLTLIRSKWKKNNGKQVLVYARTLVDFIRENKLSRKPFAKPFNNLEKEVTPKIKQAIEIRRRIKNLSWQMEAVSILQGKPKRLSELQQQYNDIPRSGEIIADSSGMKFVFFAVNSNTAGLGDFMISQNEVTVAEYKQFAAARKATEKCAHLGSKPLFKRFTWQKLPFKQTAKHPVVCVSATNASAYAKWLSAKTGHRYRLPTKQEWLYLNQISNHKDSCQYANLAGTEIKTNRKLSKQVMNCKDGHQYTAEVGSFPTNKYQLSDLNGNVAEWVSLCKDSKKCGRFGMAGNSWQSGKKNLNNKSVTAMKISDSQSNLGFRLVREL